MKFLKLKTVLFTDINLFCVLCDVLSESGPPPPHGVPFESSHECAKSIETDQRKEESLILILCSELRRQFIRFRDASGGGGGDGVEGERSGLGTEKHTADWIKKCCSSLSSLCYYGDSSSSLQGKEY